MFPIARKFLSGLFILLSFLANSQLYQTVQVKKLLAELKTAGTDSLKIEKLSSLAFYYSDFLGDKSKADSVSRLFIEIAENNYRPGLLVFAYNKYIESNDPGMNLQKSLGYALKAVELSKQANNTKAEWRSCSNLVKVYLTSYKYDKALGSSYEALSLADAINDLELKATSYLLIGQSLEGNNQKIEAFRNYLNAVALAEKTGKPALLKNCYAQLSGFYNLNKLFDKSIAYKLKQVELIENDKPIDSVEFMWAQYDLQAINLNSNNNKLNTQNMQAVLDFAFRNKSTRLKNYEIALYRSYLIEADSIKELNLLYNYRYPDEFKQLAKENPALYFRLKAYFFEEAKIPDSANYYMTKSEQYISSDPNKILQSNFYLRFGQFLIRQGKPSEAIAKYLKSYALAKEASYFEYMVSASKSLESLYAKMGDYKNAYTYATFNKSLSDSITMLTKNDQLLVLEIDHESHQRELAAEQEQLKTQRRHNLQYSAITIIIISLFIVLMMLGSLKVPAWTIKMLGFFSFILFFEFIIMIADHKIYEITANEPWKILLIKIGLIAFLLPFHHWIERKVTQFLIDKKLIKIPRFSIQEMVNKHLKRNNKNSEIKG